MIVTQISIGPLYVKEESSRKRVSPFFTRERCRFDSAIGPFGEAVRQIGLRPFRGDEETEAT